MKIFIPEPNYNYRLIDSGNGGKLEQYGSNTIIRPDTNCVWAQSAPHLWEKAQAQYKKNKATGWEWQLTKDFKEPWLFSYTLPAHGDTKSQKIVCSLRASQSKNIGIFPEQATNWEWMARIIQDIPSSPTVLNLFGYTGAATLVAAAAGAEVCHVDASKSAINWAKENQNLSKLDHTPIRWINEDCAKFLTREIKRGMEYDALIIDPPAFGRDTKGKIFEFEKEIYKLLGLCKQALKPKPLFVIFNGYSMGYSATVLKNLLEDFFPDQDIEYGELHLPEHKGNRTLPCSLVARFCN